MVDDNANQEFDTLVRRAGLRIAPERRKTMLSAYLQVVAWSEIVHDYHLLAQMEPSNVFGAQSSDAKSGSGS